MAFIDSDLLATLDELRAIPGEFGLHPYQVWVRVETYSGSRPGLGTRTITETQLLVGGQNPKVDEVKNLDKGAGSAEFAEAEYSIGPLTPPFATGGVSDNTLGPAKTGTATEVTYLLKGPGLPTNGLLCARVADHVDSSMHKYVHVRSIGRSRPTT